MASKNECIQFLSKYIPKLETWAQCLRHKIELNILEIMHRPQLKVLEATWTQSQSSMCSQQGQHNEIMHFSEVIPA